MAIPRYLNVVAGKQKQIAAIVTTAIDSIVSTDSTGKLDISLMPVGVAAETISLITSENLVSGDFVNIYNNSGTITARKADATTSAKPAHGFVLANVTSPASCTVYAVSNTNTALTGLTIGSDYYLSTTPGTITTTAPSTAGNIIQPMGRAHSTTAIVFSSAEYIELA